MDQQLPEAVSNTLSKLGLNEFYPNKLTLRSLLEINKDGVHESPASSVKEIPSCFLKKLLKVNAECRSCVQLPGNDDDDSDPFNLSPHTGDDSDHQVGALDLIVALFLCADSFLQQEMALKMSMCQFSVPLLLPYGNNSQGSLMLWALSDIIKEWRTSDLSESRGFVENSVVQVNTPFYSFVRLKNCSLSKSQLLNHILSHSQQNKNLFIHRDMEGETLQRQVANGLVEVCWYLPCGKENLDIFPEPVAFANLRGGVCESPAQFRFLFQVSTATFVAMDKVEENELDVLTSLEDVKSKLFLVVSPTKGSSEDMMSVKTTMEKLDLPKNHLIIKEQKVNLATFSKKLCAAVNTLLTPATSRVSIANMRDQASAFSLSVDQSGRDEEEKKAEEIMKGIGVRSIPDYKKQMLCLQGENWKKLSQLEKEECRLNGAGDSEVEHYKSQLDEEKRAIRKEQGQNKLSKAMELFIHSLSTSDKEKRGRFLKWMKLKLDSHSRNKLSDLRNKLQEQQEKKNLEGVAELDRALLDSSLGVEHYMREMGLIYEFSKDTSGKVSGLPKLAAELVLDGHALELLDGDASNIPERWLSAVLMEVHKRVGGQSRLLVLTVLGVQSTGKSTLLNTMFGVQFPVSSGRCTRGAYMIFLKVSEDYKRDLNYDFIVLIDTEGLKSPLLAQLEDSYEHDNQLATFVIGLSDITIINIAMENSTEMKDILQIAVHAFLRMKEIGKKPVCHFVHQNVAGVSAHSKSMIDRKHLMDQLNEMTRMAAEMEMQPSFKAFTDVLEYDMEKNNWYIPGLWHGTPPMAPVSTGYSEAAAEVKKNLMKAETSSDGSQIPEFLEWMKSLWKAVKFEKFIFSFRNTLVAHAYDNLCKEFTQWEWELRREILTWKTEAEVEIHNADGDLEDLVSSKKSEASKQIEAQQKLMNKKIFDYYKRKNVHAHLIEKYRKDFVINVRSLANEIQTSVNHELDCALELQRCSKEVQKVHRQHRRTIEEQVKNLLSECRKKELSDEQLTDEFNQMWAKATENISTLKEQDISENIRHLLRKSFSNRNVAEEFHHIGDLRDAGQGRFKAETKHVKHPKTLNLFHKKAIKRDLQQTAENIIQVCKEDVLKVTKRNTDYNEFYTKELLDKINEALTKTCKHYKVTFEFDLKVHICAFASRKFLEMHRNFLANNNPLTQLEKNKKQYLQEFLGQFKQTTNADRDRDEAREFLRVCIRPAVEDFISRSLGIDIVDEILSSSVSEEYSSHSFFQYNVQTELLLKDDFQSFIGYITNYEQYIKNWILQHIQEKMSQDKTLCRLKSKKLNVIVKKITEAINRASEDEAGALLPDNQGVTHFISNMQKYLVRDLSFSVEAEKVTLFQTQSKRQAFIDDLRMGVNTMTEQLQEDFSSSEDVTETLERLSIKPQDELFRRVFGCGRQCPFCKVPCQAGGKEHLQHRAAVHRPQGFGGFRSEATSRLVETLCTTDVYSQRKFRNADTEKEWHPYKEYTKFYPDWHIPPDPSAEASDYWKYIFVKYNDRLAEHYKAKPAHVPKAWKSITKERALKGLKDAFNVK